MNTFGRVAVAAALHHQKTQDTTPVVAWDEMARKHLAESKSMQKKCCPKCAFLALCEIGVVRGIPPGTYTKSVKNKSYTLSAYALLIKEPILANSRDEWWSRATSHNGVRQNHQLDVILALREAKLLSFK